MGNKIPKPAPPHVHGRSVAGLRLKQDLDTAGGAPTFQYFDTTTGTVSDDFLARIDKVGGGAKSWQFEGLNATQLIEQLDTSPDARFIFRTAFPEIPMVQSLPQWRTLATKNKATAASDNVFTNTTLNTPSGSRELSIKIHAADDFGSIDGVADAVVERLRKNKQTTMKNYFKAILGITVVGGISVAVLQNALEGDEDCRLENRTTGDSKFLNNDPSTCTQENWCYKCCAECKASGSSQFKCPGDTDTEGDVYVCDPGDVAQSRHTRMLLSAAASEALHSAKVHAAGSKQSKTVSPTRSAVGDWFTGESQSCTVCGTCPSADIQLCGTQYNTVSDWMADRAADAGMVVKDLGEGLLDFVPDDLLDPLKTLFRIIGIIVAIMVGLAVLGGTVKLVKLVRRRKKAVKPAKR